MKIFSWNINGVRAIIKKNFFEIIDNLKFDFFCLQEIRTQNKNFFLPLKKKKNYIYYSFSKKKGYSGVCIISKKKAINVFVGLGTKEFDIEGRIITCEFKDFFLVCLYSPNSQRKLKRLNYRLKWEKLLKKFLLNLKKKKKIIICGDFNVAHNKIDLKNPNLNTNNAGFSIFERKEFSKLLKLGFIDIFRYLNPDIKNKYTWWSYRFNARKKNIGWRIDYFLISRDLIKNVLYTEILSKIFGSDHCPIILKLKK